MYVSSRSCARLFTRLFIRLASTFGITDRTIKMSGMSYSLLSEYIEALKERLLPSRGTVARGDASGLGDRNRQISGPRQEAALAMEESNDCLW